MSELSEQLNVQANKYEFTPQRPVAWEREARELLRAAAARIEQQDALIAEVRKWNTHWSGTTRFNSLYDVLDAVDKPSDDGGRWTRH